MPALTRSRDPGARQEAWLVNYGDVQLARRRTRTDFAARYPQPAQEVALSNQYWVCSSVQPGDSEARGGHHTLAGTNDDMLAASAETHRVINRPKAKAERIAIAPPASPAYEELLELMQAFILEMELLEEANKAITEPNSPIDLRPTRSV